MVDYIFRADISTNNPHWHDGETWQGGVVPNNPDADVHVPTVTYAATGTPYSSNLSISPGEAYTINSLDLSGNDLTIQGALTTGGSIDLGTGAQLSTMSGTLNVGGSVTIGDGSTYATFSNSVTTVSGTFSIASGGGLTDYASLSAGAVVNNGLTNLGGTITTTNFENNGVIQGAGGTINAHHFVNSGSLAAYGDNTLTINSDHDGFSGLTSGTLSGGSYGATDQYGSSGNIYINDGETIRSDSATVTIDGSHSLYSYDTSSGSFVPIQSTLQTITSEGHLNIGTGEVSFGNLTDSGTISLTQTHLTASSLVIAPGGTLEGSGVISAPVVNNGTILGTHLDFNGAQGTVTTGLMHVEGDISGSGVLEVSGATGYYYSPTQYALNQSNLEIGGHTAQDIRFDDSVGRATLDNPQGYTGTIHVSSTDFAGASGDQIVLTGVAQSSITGTSFTPDTNGGTFTLDQGSGSISLHIAGEVDASSFSLSDLPPALSTDPHSLVVTVDALCLASGTMIRTSGGEVPVETLCVGDLVITSSGRARPIVWLGSRHLKGLGEPERRKLRPIQIVADAFAPGVPSHDLFLSPGHAVCLDVVGEIFVPAGQLANGATVRHATVDEVTYWHVELEEHDVLFANGLRAESYMDVGNRRWFASDDRFVEDERARERATRCARPIFSHGPIVDAIRERLQAHARTLGWASTANMAPCLSVDGARLSGTPAGQGLRFVFPADARSVVFHSKTFVPGHTIAGADARTLGVALGGLSFHDRWGARTDVSIEDAAFASLHPLEDDGTYRWRWTSGPLPLDSRWWRDCRGRAILDMAIMPFSGLRWVPPIAEAAVRRSIRAG